MVVKFPENENKVFNMNVTKSLKVAEITEKTINVAEMR